MIQHEQHTLIFYILPPRVALLDQMFATLPTIDKNLLVYMALNQLTINVTISPSLTMNIEQLLKVHLPNYTYEQHQAIMKACEQIAGILYADYQASLASARFPMPAKMITASYSYGTVSMIFECMDDKSCDWLYTTLPPM